MTFGLGKRWTTLGLVVCSVAVLGEGCTAPTCPTGWYGPIDNRDRTQLPHTDQDWVCLAVPETVPPPKPPYLDGYRPMADPQYRDHATTARAAIFLRSCDPGYFFRDMNVTDLIEATYGTVRTSVFEQALLDHSNCFQQKRNGCNAVQECLGIAFTPTNSAFTPSCNGWVAMTRFESSPGQIYDVWSNCMINSQEFNKGVDLHCFPTPEPHCDVETVVCTPDMLKPYCEGPPVNCEYVPEKDEYIARDTYRCGTFGLSCNVNEYGAGCMGNGAACELSPPNAETLMDLRAGIACEDETTLRACVNGREALLKCPSRGLNIKCIGGSRPHCGADFQCNYDGTNAPPTCEGTLIHVCNAGVPMTFDCAELGFETCDPVRGACAPKAASIAP